jgi:hypothetical protein
MRRRVRGATAASERGKRKRRETAREPAIHFCAHAGFLPNPFRDAWFAWADERRSPKKKTNQTANSDESVQTLETAKRAATKNQRSKGPLVAPLLAGLADPWSEAHAVRPSTFGVRERATSCLVTI